MDHRKVTGGVSSHVTSNEHEVSHVKLFGINTMSAYCVDVGIDTHCLSFVRYHFTSGSDFVLGWNIHGTVIGALYIIA